MTPRRVKVAGDLFHGRVPDGAVYVGRQAVGLRHSPYANPHLVGKPCPAPACGGGVHDRAGAVRAFRRHEVAHLPVHELAGRDLACWCRLDQPCHADVLLEVAARRRAGLAT